MSIPAQQQSLRTRVFGTDKQPVVVGIAGMVVTAAVGAIVGRIDIAILSPAVGGLLGGFQFGKQTTAAPGIGIRIGLIPAVTAWVGSLLLVFVFYFLVDGGAIDLGPQLSLVARAAGMFSFYGFYYILVSGIFGTLGGAVGTNLRRMLVPHEYNPPLH